MEGVELMTYISVNDSSFPLMLSGLKYSFVIPVQANWNDEYLQQTWML